MGGPANSSPYRGESSSHRGTSPNTGSTDVVGAAATKPGAAIVWAVGESGPPGSFNPLVLQNG
jgi:hypothetical protein